MPFDIDASPLFRQPAPSPLSQGISGIGNVLDAIIQRRQQKEMARMQQEAQAEQRRLDRQHEQSHWNQIDSRERDRYAAEDKRYQQKSRAEMAGALAEDYAKNQGRNAGLIAGGYGGRMEEVMEPVTQDPRSPALADIDEDPSAPPPQARPTGRQRISGLGDPIEFTPNVQDRKAHFARLRAQLQGMQPSPMREIELRRVAEAEALESDPKATAEMLEQERDRQAQNMRAAMQARASGAVKPSQQADDDRASWTAFRATAADWEKAANVDKLTDAADKFREMNANVQDAKKSGDVISQRSALYQTARYISGPGVLTEGEYTNIVSKTGGLLSSALTKLQKNLDGEISEQEAAALDKFVANANEAIRRRAIGAVKNFRKRFGSGYAASNPVVAREAQAYEGALMDRFGLTPEDVEEPRQQGQAPKSIRRLAPADEDRMKRAGF
jgi:hypothetical protein